MRGSESDRRVHAFAVALAAAGAWGCLPREPVGDVGAPDLATVQSRIFTPLCASSDCHGGPDPRRGLNLEPGMAVASLVGVMAEEAPLYRVLPGDSENSYLIHKLRGTQDDVGGSGERMPLDANPLSDAEIALVAAWIDGLTVPLPPPTIGSVTPAAASTGSLVLVAGENFGAAQADGTVTFGGVDATGTIASWSPTSIEVAVPAALMPGPAPVVVEVGGQASAPFDFDVLAGVVPSIIGVIPDTSVIGATIEVRGSNFGATQGTSLVSFGALDAVAYDAWANGSILVVVPPGAASGDVTVTVGGATSNAVAFYVVEPTLASLQAGVFDRRCATANCHDGAPGEPTPSTDCPPAATSGPLDLRAGMTFGALVSVDSCELPGTPRVTPGDRAASYLMSKLSLAAPPVGGQMPLDATPLSAEVLEAVGIWIDMGALNN